ncbi:hypothetical protein [Rhizobium giardinii]|jgi:hypothetical protein|uniref:Uncharacterized protein n=1 Tax=Rhizobium giardinii TaxID=56731 RepID=A0A7W8UHJ7_9HYPH|nr:hypothetical protein [Rhizobium giardinii]MBB5539506.1 hypothetical protein [Rhizobium giardinii]
MNARSQAKHRQDLLEIMATSPVWSGDFSALMDMLVIEAREHQPTPSPTHPNRIFKPDGRGKPVRPR